MNLLMVDVELVLRIYVSTLDRLLPQDLAAFGDSKSMFMDVHGMICAALTQ
jgi:hypothetical protein